LSVIVGLIRLFPVFLLYIAVLGNVKSFISGKLDTLDAKVQELRGKEQEQPQSPNPTESPKAGVESETKSD
jgi:hypothetical protein